MLYIIIAVWLCTLSSVFVYRIGRTLGYEQALLKDKELNPIPVNLINGVWYPEPNDPNWQLVNALDNDKKEKTFLVNGNVRLNNNYGADGYRLIAVEKWPSLYLQITIQDYDYWDAVCTGWRSNKLLGLLALPNNTELSVHPAPNEPT